VEINELLQQITDTCKENISSGNWNKNEAMRYAYVTLGKELSKSAKFFFSIEGKYGEHGLSVEEMKKIHYADSGKEVTCYVSAKMLKDIFSKLGIESTIIQSAFARPYESEDGVLDIYHSYLLCTGEEGKKYFLSLNSDLVNIKLGAAPEHFGVDVPYYYKGKQSYQGPEIDNATFTPEQLLEIDKKIGYAMPIYDPQKDEEVYVYVNLNDPKHDIYGRQKLPYDYLYESLPYLDQNFIFDFENLLFSFKHKDGAQKEKFSELSTEELREVEWFIFNRCLELVMNTFDIKKVDINRFLDVFDNPEFDLDKLMNEAKAFVQTSIDNNITTEIEQVIKLAPCKIIGITGSKGKTTTTTILHKILTGLGYHAYLGGNIGTPLFSKLNEMKETDIVVLELSSFQLMNMTVSPHISNYQH